MNGEGLAGGGARGLATAVRRRLVSDVPVGVLLSGGVDSSLIVALLAELGQEDLSTFSIGFDAAGGEEGDEFRYSDLMAKTYGPRHHRIRIDGNELVPAIEDTIGAMTEPMGTQEAAGFYLLSRTVSEHIKVVQSGQGADEVFAGYAYHQPSGRAPRDAALDAAVDAFRVPFLDQDLVALAAQCPPELKASQGGKGILKDVARKVLPAEVIDRPKGYFPVPPVKFLAEPLLTTVREALRAPEAKDRGLFRADYVDRLLGAPNVEYSPGGNNLLWQPGVLELWLQRHGITG